MKAGDKVTYCGKTATVIEVLKNGVRIGYWHQKPHAVDAEYRVERVARRYLTAA